MGYTPYYTVGCIFIQRVVGEPYDPNFRSVIYSAIFSIESEMKNKNLVFPENSYTASISMAGRHGT